MGTSPSCYIQLPPPTPGYNTCEVVKKRKVVPIKMRYALYQFRVNSIKIELCVQFFTKLLPNITIFIG